MRTYTIEKTCGAPDWNEVLALEADNHLWIPSENIRMTVQICYDEEALYLRMRAVEREVRAEHRGPLCPVCEDSCMEFFFSPEGDDRYLNVELNPNGCSFIGIGTSRADRVRITLEQEAEVLQTQTARTPDGWELTYRLPLTFLRVLYPALSLTPGTVLRANCYKCGDLTPEPHYLSWNPVISVKPDFHRPCDFGRMVLG